MRNPLHAALATLAALRLAWAGFPGSQGDQDRVLHELFYEVIGVTNKYYVEFGGCGHLYPGSNTKKLAEPRLFTQGSRWQKNQTPWDGLLMDGSPQCNSSKNFERRSFVHQEFITPQNINALFDKYGVPAEPDYVSIDIDSTDLFLLKALISRRSRYRARVFTIEYNSNFGAEHAITMPDPALSSTHNFTLPVLEKHYGKNKGTRLYSLPTCYQGASARAIEMVANAHDYVVVNRSLGYDLFLVRGDVWRRTGRRVPSLEELKVERCMNAPMIPEQAVNLMDYRNWSESKHARLQSRRTGADGNGPHAHADDLARRTCLARLEAARQLRRLADPQSGASGVCSNCFRSLRNLPDAMPECEGSI